jgi:hypothetical protein
MRWVFDDHQNSAPVFSPALHPARCILHRSTACAPMQMPPPHSLANPLFSAHRSLRHIQGFRNRIGFNTWVLDAHFPCQPRAPTRV